MNAGTVRQIRQPALANVLSIDLTGQDRWRKVNIVRPNQRANSPRPISLSSRSMGPVDGPVQINLMSRDVIHSFWVPKLGGKLGMIPSRTNVTWLQADKVGDFRGQCREFCELQQANMAFNVREQSKPDFEAWRDRQLMPAPVSTDESGFKTFLERCAVCHTIRGTPAGGILARPFAFRRP